MTAPVQVKMTRSTALALPTLPSLAEPLTVRRAEHEDAADLTKLCGRAYVGELWTTHSTECELFLDKTVKAVLIIKDQNRLVSTASLQVHNHPPLSGQLRWVATEPDWQRQGLAKHLVLRLLEIAKTEACTDMHLNTTTDALGAITLYLQLGFKPMLSNTQEHLIWKDVFRLIGVKPCF